ncbi:MAG: GAF domain-containing protein [Anaerolineae bacterium]|nr:GAF domain-containing protein [Anaerolineae bacterium]
MRNILDWLLDVHSDDEMAVQRGKMLCSILLVLVALDLLLIVMGLFDPAPVYEFLVQESILLFAFVLFFWLVRQGYRWPPYAFLAFTACVPAFILSPDSALLPAIALPVAMAPLIVPSWVAIPTAILEIIMIYVTRSLRGEPLPPIELSLILGVLGLLSWFSSSSIERALENARESAQALAKSNQALLENSDKLQVQARDLAQRARYLEATALIAQDAASLLEQDVLIARVVNSISREFGFYHTGLFLLDSTGQWAELRAASGEMGQKMLARGYRLRVGEMQSDATAGIVGYVASRGGFRIALDVGEHAVFFDNPDLPGTRSELAICLRARDEIIGVLDVHSVEPEAFSDQDISVLQSLVDQVAVAINNARLFQRVEESLESERRAYGAMRLENWQELLRTEPNLGAISTGQGTTSIGELWYPEMETAIRTVKVVRGERDEEAATVLAMPIQVGGRVVGVIEGRKLPDRGDWTEEQVSILEALIAQLGSAVERAQLYRETQRNAAREQMLGQVAGRVRETLDLESVLQTAAVEMRQALGLDRVVVQLADADRVGDSRDGDAAGGGRG